MQLRELTYVFLNKTPPAPFSCSLERVQTSEAKFAERSEDRTAVRLFSFHLILKFLIFYKINNNLLKFYERRSFLFSHRFS